jgi:hypothetical protein
MLQMGSFSGMMISYRDSTVNHGAVMAMGMEFGKSISFQNNFGIRLHAGLNSAYAFREKYDWYENSVLIAKARWNYQPSVEIPAGISIDKWFTIGNWILDTYADVTLSHRAKTEGPSSNFIVYDGSKWKTYHPDYDQQTSTIIAVGSKINFKDNFSLALDWTSELSGDYTETRLAASIGLSF